MKKSVLTRVAALAALSLVVSGCVFTWGANNFGQLGNIDNGEGNASTPSIDGGFLSLGAGVEHTCGITSHFREMLCWGNNDDAQLGVGDNFGFDGPIAFPIEVTGSIGGWRAVVAGRHHTCAIQDNRSVACWGRGEEGQLGVGVNRPDATAPVNVSDSLKFTQITAGYDHTCGILVGGTARCWGKADQGQTGSSPFFEPSNGEVGTPQPVVLRPDFGAPTVTPRWKRISANRNHTCGIQVDDTAWCWGANIEGEAGFGPGVPNPFEPDGYFRSPYPVASSATWTDIAAGAIHTCGIQSNGSLWCWGLGTRGQLGTGQQFSTNVPIQEVTGASDWKSVTAGLYHTCATKSDGRLFCWGIDADGQLGTQGSGAASLVPVQESSNSQWATVSAGQIHTCGIKADRALECWGNNRNGELGTNDYFDFGDNDFPNAITPTPIGNDTDIAIFRKYGVVSAGGSHTCVIMILVNQARCSGANTDGQLGIATTNPGESDSFVTVDNGISRWSTISAGLRHTCGIGNDGALWCWGNNDSGQLGTGDVVSSATPVRIGAGDFWASVSAGGTHTCAIANDASMYCWGDNTDGRLGIDSSTITRRLTPTPVSGPDTWATIAAGLNHSCAVATTGTAFCWGSNQGGALGGFAGTEALAPAAVQSTLNFSAIDVGDDHSCARTSSARIYCWGSNDFGQLGTGDFASRPLPNRVGFDAGWKEVTTGSNHTCGVRVASGSGSLWCWGAGSAGQLGNGSTTDSNTPVQVGTANWQLVDAGGDHTVAVDYDGWLDGFLN